MARSFELQLDGLIFDRCIEQFDLLNELREVLLTRYAWSLFASNGIQALPNSIESLVLIL